MGEGRRVSHVVVHTHVIGRNVSIDCHVVRPPAHHVATRTQHSTCNWAVSRHSTCYTRGVWRSGTRGVVGCGSTCVLIGGRGRGARVLLCATVAQPAQVCTTFAQPAQVCTTVAQPAQVCTTFVADATVARPRRAPPCCRVCVKLAHFMMRTTHTVHVYCVCMM